MADPTRPTGHQSVGPAASSTDGKTPATMAEERLSLAVARARELVVDAPTERRSELLAPALAVIAARGEPGFQGSGARSVGAHWRSLMTARPVAFASVAAVCALLLLVGARFVVGFGSDDVVRVQMNVAPAEHGVGEALELPGVRVELRADTRVEVVQDERSEVSVATGQSANEPQWTSKQWASKWSSVSTRSVAPAAMSEALAQSVSGTAVTLAQGIGQATYRVDPQAKRKLRVVAGGVTISVKGTQFLVERDAAQVRVRVYGGVVEVQHEGQLQTLRADEQVVVGLAPATAAGEVRGVAESADEPAEQTGVETEPVRPVAPSPRARSQEADEPSTRLPRLSALQELVRRADAARAGGQKSESVKLLRQLLREYPADGRVASWHFTLGRAYRATGQTTSAARAFGACRRAAPSGVLAHDALAEEARAWSAAGQTLTAAALAEQYLGRYPKGHFAGKMRSLLR